MFTGINTAKQAYNSPPRFLQQYQYDYNYDRRLPFKGSLAPSPLKTTNTENVTFSSNSHGDVFVSSKPKKKADKKEKPNHFVYWVHSSERTYIPY